MAKLKNSLESTLSGKIGNVVFVQMDGKTYARAVPKRKKGSWSKKQQLHRQRFRAVNNFCHQLLDEPLRRIWNHASPSGRGYSLFVKSNMPVFALDGSMTDIGMLQMTAGKLHLPQQLTAEKAEVQGSLLNVTWKNDPNLTGERLNDQLMAVCSDGRNFSKIQATGIQRGKMEAAFVLPPLRNPLSHVWLFFSSEDEMNASESRCFELKANSTN